ncbi:MAG: P-loop NTPase fold protein [Leptospiraceae bacterium]|nr:P-loop NTPase fold protein [Leptospiraceae bacterium]
MTKETSQVTLFCPRCGTKNLDIAAFCVNCGENLDKFKKAISDIEILRDALAPKSISIESQINEYANGKHFLAFDLSKSEKVVVKFISKEASKNPQLKEMFTNWCEVGSLFHHPNILSITDFGEINGRNYMVSTYADGGTLDQVIKTYGSSGISIADALNLMAKILNGLEEIHSKGYIIRDLKTSNILVLKNGEPAITGFHIAKKVSEIEVGKENSLIGSVAYMSPERCRLNKKIDFKSDIYSAGIVFYELMTGELPFRGETEKVLFQQTNKPIPNITYKLISKGLNSLNKNEEKVYQYVGEIQRILEKACAKSKSNRYKTATEFSNDIKKFLKFISIPTPFKKTRDDQWKVLNGYRADQSGGTGEDRLGITGSVEAFARLISSRSVQPPLSIGLFGNWGAGKSFFINKLKSEINKLSSITNSSIEEGIKHKDLPFYSKIIQIEFNAWHFVDANLWASLVNHIFSNLKIENEPTNGIMERRNFLIQRIEGEKQGLKDLEKTESEFLGKVQSIEKQIEDESTNYKKTLSNLFKNKFSNETEIFVDKKVIESWAKKAGIDISIDEASSEKIHKLYLEAQKYKDPSLQEMLKRRFKAYSWFVAFSAVAFISIFIISLFTILYQETSLKDWIATQLNNGFDYIKIIVGGFLSFAASFAAIGKAVIEFSKKYLNWAPKFLDKLKEMVPEFNKELANMELERENKFKELEEEKNSFLTKKANIQEQISKLESELSETTEGDLLKNFVQSRIGSDDYSKHLGIQAKIRDDFEKLSNLITSYNMSLTEDDPISTKESQYLFNRIVLYIDDLDRCPPEKVVEVLQAVHLLLSFPAFVVVVAVDSRWVSQSLKIGYRELFGDDLNVDSDGDGIPDFFRATPHDYLEKIFQIPFWLYPMNMEGRRSLITTLMESSMLVEKIEETNTISDTLPSSPVVVPEIKLEEEGLTNETQDLPDLEETIAEEYSPVGLMNEISDQLVIQRNELEFSIVISPILGQSPRALKRFVNVYLLVKVGLSDLQWQIYFEKIHPKTGLKEEAGIVRNYQTVMILLAVITGLPSTSRIFFKALRTKSLMTLNDLLNAIDVKKVDGKWFLFGVSSDEITIIKRQVKNEEFLDKASTGSFEINRFNMQVELLQFTKWLDVNAGIKDWGSADLEQFRYWDPIVSKYSFRVEPFEQD